MVEGRSVFSLDISSGGEAILLHIRRLLSESVSSPNRKHDDLVPRVSRVLARDERNCRGSIIRSGTIRLTLKKL